MDYAIIIVLWISLSLAIGYSGSKRRMGFWMSFFLSFILSPLWGFLITSSSHKIQDENAKEDIDTERDF
ncbi:MAG: hypothetical protein EA412_01100 [Chitinophagaceae bacterium]|nr:MAG: hypothetical protein EA412_01100 [Chitinophagaceae bacterium]